MLVSKRGSWPHFYQTRSDWSMDQGSTKKRSAVHNFVLTVTKFWQENDFHLILIPWTKLVEFDKSGTWWVNDACWQYNHINGFVHDCSMSSVLDMEILQYSTQTSRCTEIMKLRRWCLENARIYLKYLYQAPLADWIFFGGLKNFLTSKSYGIF